MNYPELDPDNSVVVEACAGSGKTWLLASRLVRLLLAGVPPSKILAITYTRKAAAEIEARLAEWLRELAMLDDAGAIKFLTERGLAEREAREALPRARALLESVLLAEQPPTITTFHGWFVRLISAAPLNAGLSGLTLAESSQPLLDEAWARLARAAAREPAGQLAACLLELFREPGIHNTRKLLDNFIDRRAEWQAQGLTVDEALARLRSQLGVAESPRAMEEFFARPGMLTDLRDFAGLLIANGGKETQPGVALQSALDGGDRDVWFGAVCGALLTKEDKKPRSRKTSKAMQDRMGVGPAESFISLHESLSVQAEDLVYALQEEAAYAMNRAALIAGEALAAELAAYKESRRLMDFSDLENHADALLKSEDAPFLQARLDARYQHILLDEFQDTNPLQWRILQSWFDAYGPGEARPRVFMVGDPKQSIYRFRRAEPRIFGAAARYLEQHFGAVRSERDITRRNAPEVVEVVNALFAHEPVFEGFRDQAAHEGNPRGGVMVVPLVQKAQIDAAQSEGLRHPLHAAEAVNEDKRRVHEAALIASQIKAWVGRLAVVDGGVRPARFGDFMLLCRNRTHLAHYERALRDADVPYFSGSRAGLLHTLEAQDMAALLGFLASPADDLKLAHALRSPIFDVSDDDLVALYAGRDEHAWQRLTSGAVATASLTRAQGLLSKWLGLAAHWPVHDVLSAIYTDADVLARYRAAVPALAWPAVRANLEAFLRLSLEQGGGRYPSLTRFNDELKRLRAGADEAPDEGMITGADAGGRVRILTIHAAKGLEAPLVWLIDAHSPKVNHDGFDVLLDWPPDEAAPTHFSLTGAKATRGRARAHLFEQEARAAEREELNLLYVAITRARQYFVASGIEPAKNSSRPSFYARIRQAIERLGGEGATTHGGEWPLVDAAPQLATAPTATQPRRPKLAIGTRREALSERQRYGTELHRVMECLTQSIVLPNEIDAAVVEHAKSILAAPHLARFFDPAQYVRARNEIEFALPDGNSGRIDRLVESQDALWVIDYKAGREEDSPMEEYREQLQRYRAAVGALHPGCVVRCALIFGDASLCEV